MKNLNFQKQWPLLYSGQHSIQWAKTTYSTSPQAGMFYIPRLLWKSAEGGIMKLLCAGLTDIASFMNKELRRDGVDLIAKYFNTKHTKRGTYFMKFVTCEVLNFVNVVGQIFFTDMFLGYKFQQFGREVFSFTEQDMTTRTDPLDRLFPKVLFFLLLLILVRSRKYRYNLTF